MGFDAFEWVIPDSHPKFRKDVLELELARFRFQGGQEFEGMFDGSKCFSIYLCYNLHSLWHGVAPPRAAELAGFKAALSELGLALPDSGQNRPFNMLNPFMKSEFENF
jgi:hypothetical protein